MPIVSYFLGEHDKPRLHSTFLICLSNAAQSLHFQLFIQAIIKIPILSFSLNLIVEKRNLFLSFGFQLEFNSGSKEKFLPCQNVRFQCQQLHSFLVNMINQGYIAHFLFVLELSGFVKCRSKSTFLLVHFGYQKKNNLVFQLEFSLDHCRFF